MLNLQALTFAMAGGAGPAILIIAVIAVLAIICIANMHVVPQGKAYVVEHLGSYRKTWQTGGIKFTIPFFQRVAKKINLMEQVADFPPQPVITKDNVRMQIDTVVFFQITDCKLYAYGHTTPMTAIENLTSTTLRNIIGELELDATLTSRDLINTQMRSILDEATDPWGIKVTRVELKNIIPPKEIQDAMEKQMKAERERRESILRADAAKQAKIMEAEAEAEAILRVQQATADAMRLLNEAAPNDQVVKIKALEAFAAAANGHATKIIIPSEIQSLAGLAASAQALLDKDEK